MLLPLTRRAAAHTNTPKCARAQTRTKEALGDQGRRGERGRRPSEGGAQKSVCAAERRRR
jgi:hypothetical protein